MWKPLKVPINSATASLGISFFCLNSFKINNVSALEQISNHMFLVKQEAKEITTCSFKWNNWYFSTFRSTSTKKLQDWNTKLICTCGYNTTSHETIQIYSCAKIPNIFPAYDFVNCFCETSHNGEVVPLLNYFTLKVIQMLMSILTVRGGLMTLMQTHTQMSLYKSSGMQYHQLLGKNFERISIICSSSVKHNQ